MSRQPKPYRGTLGEHPSLKLLKRQLDADLAVHTKKAIPAKKSIPVEDGPKPRPQLVPGKDIPLEWSEG